MKYFDWNETKNDKLREEREICFEDVVVAISEGKVHDVLAYPNQRFYIVGIQEYIYVVPFVEDEIKIFLKTIYPSRKLTKKYLKGGK
ncbi:MAG TPA: toxin [Candidatus Saccharimonadia bacterium]|nr:toxin [Candidatus Saccharimonadia bacterium]